MSQRTVNQVLGDNAAKEIDRNEQRFPAPTRSRFELLGVLEKQFNDLRQAIFAKPGPGTHGQIQEELSQLSAMALRGKKDIPSS